jgi:hypothetical protein
MSRTRKPADLPPPPAELSPELLASLPPPPPAAEAQPEPPAVTPEERAAIDRAVEAELRCERLAAENAQLRAELAGKAPAKPGSRRNFAFDLANGSRQIRSGATEKEARARLGADGETAKFKGCLP